MWRSLGPNLNECNAARIAGMLDSFEQILTNVDKDCQLSRRSSYRSTPNKEKAVYQIIADLMSVKAMEFHAGRTGHASFPNIKYFRKT